MPKGHVDFYYKLVNVTSYIFVAANRERIGFKTGSPQDDWFKNVFSARMTTYQSAYNDWINENNRSPEIIDKLRQEEKEMRELFRQLYTGFLKDSPLVTDHDLSNMRLPARPGERHPAPVADDTPATRPVLTVPRVVKIRFGTPGEGSMTVKRGKPPGQHGAEFRWVLSPVPVQGVQDLLNSSFDTNSPLVLEFTEEDRGKALYYAARWENTRGEKGPFSDIEVVHVP
jgi:hypothetical protein